MKRVARLCLALLLLPLAACTQAPESGTDVADTRAKDEAAIRALRKAFNESQQAGDAEGCAAFYADDAIIMVPGEPSVTGIDAIRRGGAAYYGEYEWNTQEPIEELQVLGDWAFTRTTWSGVQTEKATGTAEKVAGKALHIYRRQPDGTWKIAIDIYNFDHPVDPS
jgi:uncharacterized protein (TIGR02246 family)